MDQLERDAYEAIQALSDGVRLGTQFRFNPAHIKRLQDRIRLQSPAVVDTFAGPILVDTPQGPVERLALWGIPIVGDDNVPDGEFVLDESSQ